MAGGIEATGPDLAAEGVPSEEIGEDRPFAARVGDDPVVVVRHGGTVHAVGGKCTHYGSSLAGGICVDNELRCPRHH
ncbi:MAG: Rieske 2Fe-2S domain-containing protein, partial [Acidimicrobiia bacterium]|nr:Rieske 2Fe-2S domain-containing protein [Acidimicrobiia bacterium]